MLGAVRRRWKLGVVPVALVCVLAAANYRRVEWWVLVRTNPILRESLLRRPLSDVDELADLIELSFPPESILRASHARFWLWDELIAVVELPRGAVGELLSALAPSAEVSRTDRLGISSEGPRWWRPETAHHFVAIRLIDDPPAPGFTASRQYECEELHLLIDLDDARTAVIYVEWEAD